MKISSYNRSNVYIHNKYRISIDWFQFKIKGQTAVVMREGYTEGPSVTNTIEGAIERLLYIFQTDVIIFQDCDEEGIFKINYKATAKTTYDREYEIYGVNWQYFCKDISSLELLYAKT